MMRMALLCPILAAACGGDPAPADSAPASASDRTPAPASGSWIVQPDSFGVIPLGVPLERAAAALGAPIPVDSAQFDLCTHVSLDAAPGGTLLMVLRDTVGGPIRVSRVDVVSGDVRTLEGAGVGDAEADVVARYQGRVRVEPHKYTGPQGHYLVVTSPRDTAYMIIFETDGSRVLRYRAGKRPAVEFVEGCA